MSESTKKTAAKKTTSAKDSTEGQPPEGETSTKVSGSPDAATAAGLQPDDTSAIARPQQGADGDPSVFAENVRKEQEAQSQVSGPNHDLPDPTPENTARMPSATMTSEAGPLEPATDALLQSDPVPGYALSSTDPVYGNTGGQTVAGEKHDSLEDEEGNAISAADLFRDDDGSKTFVTVDKRVFEVFYYPNTTERARRLLYTPGQRINRADAERMKASLSSLERQRASA